MIRFSWHGSDVSYYWTTLMVVWRFRDRIHVFRDKHRADRRGVDHQRMIVDYVDFELVEV